MLLLTLLLTLFSCIQTTISKGWVLNAKPQSPGKKSISAKAMGK